MANANTLRDRIRSRALDRGGTLPWADAMRTALYEPEAGYYRRGVRRIGRAGDFYTGVSVGPAFGQLLALFSAMTWRALGGPADFAVIEQGAHDGALARDVLTGIGRSCPGLFEVVRYLAIEPDEAHRVAQRGTLAGFPGKFAHWDPAAAGDPGPSHAAFLCNELLDAMPVHRLTLTAEGWRELHVRPTDAGGFEFVPGPLSEPRLAAECPPRPSDLGSGHVIEINLDMLDWIRRIASSQFRGTVLVLDYGVTAGEMLAPPHASGTLRRYRDHRRDDLVLDDLGECDLTAHVNFTRLAKEAETSGLTVLEFIEQGRFLARLLAESAEAHRLALDPAWVRQFQTLAHPGIMGRSFHAMVLGKEIDVAALSTADAIASARRRLGLSPNP